MSDPTERFVEFARARLQEGRPDGGFWREGWQRCAAFGLHGLLFPEEAGGSGQGALAYVEAMEALGAHCPDLGLLFGISAHVLACTLPVWRFGRSEHLTRLLPELVGGRLIAANAITEARSGSDVFAMAATATRTEDGYRLDGRKTYVTCGPVADLFVTYARTDPEQGLLGISAFAVPADREGVRVGPPIEKVGLAGVPFGEVTFDGCRVAEEERIGAEGNGAQIFQVSMDWERGLVMAPWVGVMARQLEAAVAESRARQRFGKPIAEFQAVSHRLADMTLRHRVCRLLLGQAARALDERAPDRRLAGCLAKLYVSEAAVSSGLDASGLHGASGVLAGSEVARQLADALPARVFSGTSDIMRELIARELLR